MGSLAFLRLSMQTASSCSERNASSDGLVCRGCFCFEHLHSCKHVKLPQSAASHPAMTAFPASCARSSVVCVLSLCFCLSGSFFFFALLFLGFMACLSLAESCVVSDVCVCWLAPCVCSVCLPTVFILSASVVCACVCRCIVIISPRLRVWAGRGGGSTTCLGPWFVSCATPNRGRFCRC